jgi:thymidylate synthase
MNTLDKQYQDLLQDILDNGITKQDRTGTGTTSVFGRQIRHKMSEGFPLLTTKKMAWKTMVVELLWFLRGDTNIKFLVDNGCNIWTGDAYKNYLIKTKNQIEDPNDLNWDLSSPKDPKITQLTQEQFINKIKTDDRFAKEWGELGPIYGKQWRRWNGQVDDISGIGCYHDQIQNLINDLKTNPDSRRLMVNSWNVGELDQMVLPPCHFSWQCYSHEKDGKRYLSLAWNQRSVDCGLGLPFNISSYGLLLEIIAKKVNMIPYELIGNLGDCHIYNNHIEGIKEQLNREPFELPKLKMNPIFLANLEHKGLDEAINGQVNFELENYQYHPSIKLPLSN